MAEDQATGVICIGILVCIVVYRWNISPVSPSLMQWSLLAAEFPYTQLNDIPTVGGSWVPGLSYLSAIALIRRMREILHEGYKKVRRLSPPSLVGFRAWP